MVIVASIYLRFYIEIGVGVGAFLPTPTPTPPKMPSGSDSTALVWTSSLDVGAWVFNATPWPLSLEKEPQYPLYKGVGWLQGRPGGVRRREILLSSLGFEPRTAQRVESHFTNYTIPSPIFWRLLLILCSLLFGSFYVASSRQFSDQDVVWNFYFSLAYLIVFCIKRNRIFLYGLYFEMLFNVRP
jgi:hypothetical protein